MELKICEFEEKALRKVCQLLDFYNSKKKLVLKYFFVMIRLVYGFKSLNCDAHLNGSLLQVIKMY